MTEAHIYYRSKSAYCDEDDEDEKNPLAEYEMYIPSLGLVVCRGWVVVLVTPEQVSDRYKPMKGHANWDRGVGSRLRETVMLDSDTCRLILAADEARAAAAKYTKKWVPDESLTAAEQMLAYSEYSKSRSLLCGLECSAFDAAYAAIKPYLEHACSLPYLRPTEDEYAGG